MSEISVVIPLHDGARTIAETLESLRAQQVALDVIVVDDRSRDEGPAIAAAHPLAPRVVPSRGPGPAAARNTGVALARAPHTLFLDADDLLDEGALRQRLARAAPDTVVVSSYRTLRRGALRDAHSGFPRGVDPRAALLVQNRLVIHGALTPTALLQRSAQPFPDDLRSFEDWALWLKLALDGARFDVSRVPDCTYRLRDAPHAMTTAAERASEDRLAVVSLARAWLDELPLAERRALLPSWCAGRQEALFSRALARAKAGSRAKAALDVARALVAAPRHVPALPRRALEVVAARALRAAQEHAAQRGRGRPRAEGNSSW